MLCCVLYFILAGWTMNPLKLNKFIWSKIGMVTQQFRDFCETSLWRNGRLQRRRKVDIRRDFEGKCPSGPLWWIFKSLLNQSDSHNPLWKSSHLALMGESSASRQTVCLIFLSVSTVVANKVNESHPAYLIHIWNNPWKRKIEKEISSIS